MGKKAVEIANLDVNALITMLNEALAEEWACVLPVLGWFAGCARPDEK